MYANHYMDVEEKEVTLEGVKNTTIRWLVSPKVGAKNFAMRYFVIKKGGTIPIHQHDWEH
ncbi:cupin domain-containing protein, partial [Thermococci archaeon]